MLVFFWKHWILINIYKSASYFFRRNMSQMYNIALLSSLRDQIWTYLLFSKHSYTTSGFGGHIGFLKKTVIISKFWHQLHVFGIFSCWGGQMQSNKAIRFNFWSTSGYGGHFEFFNFNRFLTGNCSPNVLMTHIFVFRRSKSIR